MQQDILESVLADFASLAALPRRSGHEKAVSDFLYNWAQQQGLAVVQDEANNIIIDKPATEGCESMPTVILQGHMDMVCVAAEGKQYDALTDAIELVRQDDFLMANGTSLGADDSIGVATAMYILRTEFTHGPLRVIITTDEENGMTGAKALAPQYLQADYLINCDSEDYDVVTVSSAGSVNIDLRRPIDWQKPTKSDTYRIAIKGLTGGHSGAEIHKGRANAVKLLGLLLHFMRQADMGFELASLSGGQARNAIPASAECVVVIGPMDTYRMNNVIAKLNEYAAALYKMTDPAYYIELLPTARSERVLDRASADAVIDYLLLVQDGILKLAVETDCFVETSSNIGLISTDDAAVLMQVFPRSSSKQQLELVKAQQQRLAAALGLEIAFSAQSPAWPLASGGRLAELTRQIFAEQNGQTMRQEAIHAGLECSWFYEKNPQLEMISIGPTVLGIHSPQEKLVLRTVEPHVRLIMELLTRLATK